MSVLLHLAHSPTQCRNYSALLVLSDRITSYHSTYAQHHRPLFGSGDVYATLKALPYLPSIVYSAAVTLLYGRHI